MQKIERRKLHRKARIDNWTKLPKSIGTKGELFWLNHHPLDSQTQIPRTHALDHLQQSLSPWTESFFIPLGQGAFANQFIALEQFRQQKFVVLRDGSFGLSFFFKNYPNPIAGDYELMVHESGAGYVPRSWEEKVSFYRLTQSAAPKTKTLVIAIPWCHAFANPDAIKNLGKSIRNIKSFENIFVFAPVRFLGVQDHNVFHARALSQLFNLLGPKAEFLSWEEIVHRNLLADAVFYDGVCPNALGLSFLSHFALSRGAFLASLPSKNASADVPLSDFHGLILKNTPNFKAARSQLRQELKMHQISPTFLSLPWPHWYSFDWPTPK